MCYFIHQRASERVLFSHLRYLDGRIFIIYVRPQSQAELDEVVLVGDVIDEINGYSLRNACNGQVCKKALWSLWKEVGALYASLRSREETREMVVQCCCYRKKQ